MVSKRKTPVGRSARYALSVGALVSSFFLAATVVQGADWPHWRGPSREGKSAETGLLKSWPEGGPTLVWKSDQIGSGFSTVSIAGGVIYISGIIEKDLVVTAFGIDGNLKWQKPVALGWSDPSQRPGSRSTPTIDGNRLYIVSGHGMLVALDCGSGDTIWTVDLVEKFKGKVPQWGGAESVLIDGDRLYCTPGGAEVGMVALDKMTGEVLWQGEPLGTSLPYASPILVEAAGAKQLIHLVQTGMVGVDANAGRILWRYERAAPKNRPACSTPLYADGLAFAASGYDTGGGQVRISSQDGRIKAEQTWETREMVNQHGGMVLVDGHVYGNHQNGWSCLSWKTGEQKWHAEGVGKGSLTYADGMLYCFAEQDGTVGLVKADPSEFQMVSTFSLPAGGAGLRWAHPVVCGGRLYLRHGNTLWVYDVSAGR